MNQPTATTHYHVRRHLEDDDVFAADSLASAMDYAATELDRMVDSEHSMIRVLGEQGNFEDAYRAWDRVETWGNLQLNAANISYQLTADPADRAPLYQADDEETRARLRIAAEHTIGKINAYGPSEFVIWQCTDVECAPGEYPGDLKELE